MCRRSLGSARVIPRHHSRLPAHFHELRSSGTSLSPMRTQPTFGCRSAFRRPHSPSGNYGSFRTVPVAPYHTSAFSIVKEQMGVSRFRSFPPSSALHGRSCRVRRTEHPWRRMQTETPKIRQTPDFIGQNAFSPTRKMTKTAENYARIMRRKFEARVCDIRVQTAGICVKARQARSPTRDPRQGASRAWMRGIAPATTATYAVRLADQTRRADRTRIMPAQSGHAAPWSHPSAVSKPNRNGRHSLARSECDASKACR